MTNSKRIVISDVAQYVGVSSQTVSRVINDAANVKPATRKKVTEAIEILGYKPNLSARFLASKSTGLIEVIVDSPLFLGTSATLIAIAAQARNKGYMVTFNNGQEPENGRLPIQSDAVIVLGEYQNDREVALKLSQTQKVVLVMDTPDIVPGVTTVFTNQMSGMTKIVSHFVELGHTRIAHMVGPREFVDAQRRLDAYLHIMHSLGLTPMLFEAKSWDSSAGVTMAKEILALPKSHQPTAIACSNDALAIGLLHEFWRQGVRLPDDFSVCGWDDMPGSAFTNPSLTTIRQDFLDLAEKTIQALTHQLQGNKVVNAMLTPELIVRDSTSTPRTSY